MTTFSKHIKREPPHSGIIRLSYPTPNQKEEFPMTIIQQPTLFDIHILEKLEIEEKYQEIFSPLELSPLVALFQKETKVGPPITVNYEASIRALLV